MGRSRKLSVESKIKVPAYIVTFSDMVTLLLTFFVLLLSLATEKKNEQFFKEEKDAFKNHIQNFGLGSRSGKQQSLNFESKSPKYLISAPEETEQNRTIDTREEEMRRLFQEISKTAVGMPSQMTPQQTNFITTSIRFGEREELDVSAKKFLADFSENLFAESAESIDGIYVLGLAGDAESEREGLLISARRAEAVADFLYTKFDGKNRFPIYCWGAGKGGEWVGEESPVSKESQILIAILRK